MNLKFIILILLCFKICVVHAQTKEELLKERDRLKREIELAKQSKINSIDIQKDKTMMRDMSIRNDLIEKMKKLNEQCSVSIQGGLDCPPDISRQLGKVIQEIHVLTERMQGREKWLEQLSEMSPETLIAQEQNLKKVSEMAGLAECAYSNATTISGYTNLSFSDPKFASIILDANTRLLQDKKGQGFHCELFSQDGSEKYVLSFRGTEPSLDMRDVIEDVHGNFSNTSPQTKLAIEVTQKLLDKGIKPENIQLTGHSLGGRLAAEASIKHGLVAYTFNAADISRETRSEIGINSKGNILNTISANDPLSASTFGLSNNASGGTNKGSVRSLTSEQDGLKDHVRISKSNYYSGYTNIIEEAFGNGSSEGHSISFLKSTLEQRHNDIKDKIEEKKTD
ncbi:DUF2974 domain-containing protein [Bacteroides sp. 224]|nr:DUF2974 domain-containing protein [Bacteroides sp. 224]